jgi:hypothetical protein
MNLNVLYILLEFPVKNARLVYCFSIKTKTIFWVTLRKVKISINLALVTNTLFRHIQIFAVRGAYRTINLCSRTNHFFDLRRRTGTNTLNRTQFTSTFHANIAIQWNPSKFIDFFIYQSFHNRNYHKNNTTLLQSFPFLFLSSDKKFPLIIKF